MDEWVEPQDDNIYADEGRESQVDDGEITPEEAAFMQGYDSAIDYESLDLDDDEEAKEEES